MQSNVAIILSQNHSYGAKKQKKNEHNVEKVRTKRMHFRSEFSFFP